MNEHPLEQWLDEKKRAGTPVRRFALAKRVRCAPSRISQIIGGDEPSLALAARLSNETGIPIDKFVKAEVEQ